MLRHKIAHFRGEGADQTAAQTPYIIGGSGQLWILGCSGVRRKGVPHWLWKGKPHRTPNSQELGDSYPLLLLLLLLLSGFPPGESGWSKRAQHRGSGGCSGKRECSFLPTALIREKGGGEEQQIIWIPSLPPSKKIATLHKSLRSLWDFCCPSHFQRL